MEVESIIKNIIAVPLSKVLIHEGTIEKISKRIANSIQDDGKQQNPIIVTEKDSYYIVLDGMHRVSAMEYLKSKGILAYLINYEDYINDKKMVKGWDALIYQSFSAKEFIAKCFDSETVKITKTHKVEKARDLVVSRKCYFAIQVKGDKIYIACKKGEGKDLILENVVDVLHDSEKALDEADVERSYVCDERSHKSFESSDDYYALIIRPKFTAEEIVKITLERKLFPKKSTRHIINNRPLYADIPLSLLMKDSDFKEKNQEIQKILHQRLRDHRVRVYEESICILNE
jgi:hypothetical protein